MRSLRRDFSWTGKGDVWADVLVIHSFGRVSRCNAARLGVQTLGLVHAAASRSALDGAQSYATRQRRTGGVRLGEILVRSSSYVTAFLAAKQASLSTSDGVMRIAYLVNQYPKISHSFIRREILALERQGFEVIRIALRGWAGEVVDEEDRIERKRTRYVLREGAPGLLLALARALLTRPASLIRALALACRMGRRAERPLFVHLIYLAEACRIETWLRKAGVQHLHAHFGTNSAEVAMLVHALGGPDWSFTVHGPEEFDKPQFIGLGEKIRHCSFVVAVSSYTRSQLYRWAEHAVLVQSAGRALRVGGSIFRRARDRCTGGTAPSLRGSVMRAKGAATFGRSRAPAYGSGRGF